MVKDLHIFCKVSNDMFKNQEVKCEKIVYLLVIFNRISLSSAFEDTWLISYKFRSFFLNA